MMLQSRTLACRPQPIRRCHALRAQTPAAGYFVATNNFKVKPEYSEAFEEVWKQRETHLKEVPGFIRFALLKCSNVPGEYISQSSWESPDAFKAWTKSEQFQKSHGGQKGDEEGRAAKPNVSVADMLAGPPVPKMYDTITVTEF